MTKNRRFPFERSKQVVSLENLFTTEQQLYPMIRQYLSVNRHYTDLSYDERSQHVQQTIIPCQENYPLIQFIHYLKQNGDMSIVDCNNFVALRDHNIQRWKHVKYEWQKYYRDRNRKHRELYGSVIKSSH